MDKYEFNIKVDQIKKLVNQSDYETAIKIADTVDWKRVRNTNLLSMVALVYEKNGEYQEAKDILLMAFERAPIGKRLLYKLTELALKENNIEEAEAYYREFCDLTPDDPRQNLLRYMILKAKGAPAQQLIHSLESYTAEELDEKWMYELAKLYHEAGMGDQSVRLCDRIMLMFGLGKYVDKAMELKLQYAPLTSYQMDLVENRDKYEAKLRAVAQGNKLDVQMTPDTDDYAGDEEEALINDKLDDELQAKLQEAEEEERLAQEMSKISAYPFKSDTSPMEQTRILDRISGIKPMSDMTGDEFNPEPVIEEYLEDDGRALYDDLDHGVSDQAAYEGEYVGNPLPSEHTEDKQMPDEEPIYEPSSDPSDDAYAEAAVTAELRPDYDEGAKIANHLIIESVTSECGLQMAIEALKQIHLETGIKNQVLKINGDRLAKRGIFDSADKLAGKDLIVEEAGNLTEHALYELNDLMEKDDTGMIVVLIDKPERMEEIHSRYPALASKFECIGRREEGISRTEDTTYKTAKEVPLIQDEVHSIAERESLASKETSATVAPGMARQEPVKNDKAVRMSVPDRGIRNRKPSGTVPAARPVQKELHQEEFDESPDGDEMDIDEFAQYACRYANEIDCSITGKSMLALYERIEIMEEDGIPLNRENAEDLIEEAADRAEKPSIGKLIKGVFSSKYDKDGLLILKEEHFIG